MTDIRRIKTLLKLDQRGFTLTEIMVATVINMVILGIVWSIYLKQNRGYTIQDDVVRMQQNTRLAMDAITRDIRLAGYNHNQPTPVAPFSVATPTSITMARTESTGAMTITYVQDGSNIRKTVTAGSATSQHLYGDTTLNLAYTYKGATTTPAEARTVTITITGRTPHPDPNYPLNGGFRTFTLTSTIMPRNVQD